MQNEVAKWEVIQLSAPKVAFLELIEHQADTKRVLSK